MSETSTIADIETSGLTSSAKLVRALEDDILNDRLRPGMRLDEQVLAQRFNVSRTPVREALRHLASSGLIELRRNHGAIVKSLTINELIEMFQVMAELEGLCARLSARRMDKAEREQMRRANNLCAKNLKIEDHDAFFEANNQFHEVIYSGSHNSFLQEETRRLRNRVNVHRRFITFQPRRMDNTVKEHQAIIEAIEAGDPDAAHGLMREHVHLLAESAADVITAFEQRRSDSADPAAPSP
jgi:DNA-binding GntR family transcriptional regulator